MAMHSKPYYGEAMKSWCRFCWIELPILTPRVDITTMHFRRRYAKAMKNWCGRYKIEVPILTPRKDAMPM
jgi:hypothetical protein